jgi:hypothetical protein
MPLAATTTTSTTEVPRIVGDPLPTWQWLGAGLVLLVLILGAGWYVSVRQRRRSAG